MLQQQKLDYNQQWQKSATLVNNSTSTVDNMTTLNQQNLNVNNRSQSMASTSTICDLNSIVDYTNPTPNTVLNNEVDGKLTSTSQKADFTKVKL